MPYLQVDLDALDGFADVATATGISVGDVAMGCLRLWKHCWKNKTAHVTGDRLSSWFPGEPGKVAMALVACEFLDRPADRPDYHVRGAEKRLGVAKAQSEAGKKHVSNLRQFAKQPPGRPGDEPDGEPETTTGSTPALTSSIQHPTSNKEKRLLSDSHPTPAALEATETEEQLQSAWNEGAHPSLPRWKDMTAKRRKHARTRLRERKLDGPEGWFEVIRRINASPFLRGETGDWRASPDWLLQPDTATKVLEGKYDAGTGPPTKGRASNADKNWDEPVKMTADGNLVF